MDDIEKLDLYEILGVEPNCSAADVKKAYRKKALQCHPDKNPDNPNAAKEFHRLSYILEVLTDEAARAAYDKVLRGRKEAALRHKELDSKRRKLKEDLEAREKAARDHSKKSPDQILKEQLERLRKEGSQLVQDEMEYIRKKLQEERLNQSEEWDSSRHRIKIKWAADKNDETNGGYDHEKLHRFLSKYGDIVGLVVSSKKKGSALVEFQTKDAAEMAVAVEIGLPSNPLKLEWLNGPPPAANQARSNLVKDSDFESVVMTKMRQAEERKRIIAQMMEDEANETS